MPAVSRARRRCAADAERVVDRWRWRLVAASPSRRGGLDEAVFEVEVPGHGVFHVHVLGGELARLSHVEPAPGSGAEVTPRLASLLLEAFGAKLGRLNSDPGFLSALERETRGAVERYVEAGEKWGEAVRRRSRVLAEISRITSGLEAAGEGLPVVHVWRGPGGLEAEPARLPGGVDTEGVVFTGRGPDVEGVVVAEKWRVEGGRLVVEEWRYVEERYSERLERLDAEYRRLSREAERLEGEMREAERRAGEAALLAARRWLAARTGKG